MPLLEDAKHGLEHMTGYARPGRLDLGGLTRPRKAHLFHFQDDGTTPNNPVLPLVHYRTPVKLPEQFDPAAVFENLFAQNGWKEAWRDGIYDFLHFHTQTHEVLGIARGSARVEFGGRQGKTLALRTGDVIILPAGTGHRRLQASRDLVVVGAYPRAGRYDEPKPSEIAHQKAVTAIAKVRLPKADPVYGPNGPLLAHWH